MHITIPSDEIDLLKAEAEREHRNISSIIGDLIHFHVYGHEPNEVTLQALRDIEDGNVIRCESLEDMWSKIEQDDD